MLIKKADLDSYVTDLGLLIGLLHAVDDSTVSVNEDWFSDPVSELLATPTRVKELLNVLDAIFTPVDGVQYTLAGADAWYSIFGGWSDLPTGLSLVAPPVGATSGVLSLGIFTQLFVDDFTISLYARLPLFYLEEEKQPEFILATSADEYKQYKRFMIELDLYSSTPVQVSGDSAFNMVSVVAEAEFSDGFSTDFELNFYQGFDPKTGKSTKLAPASTEVIIERIAQLVLGVDYWLNAYIGSAPLTIGDILGATGLVTQSVDSKGKPSYSFDKSTVDQLSKDPTEVLKKFLISLVTKLVDELATAKTLLVPILGGGIYAAKDATTNTYGLRLAIPDYLLTGTTGTGPQVFVELGKWFTGETDGKNWIEQITNPPAGEGVDAGVDIFFLKYDGTTLSTATHVELASLGLDISGRADAPLINLGGYTLKRVELRFYLDSADWSHGFGLRLDDVGFPLGPNFQDTQSGGAGSNAVAKNLLASGDQQGSSPSNSAANPGFSALAAYVNGHDPLLEIFDPQGQQTDLIWFPIQRRLGPLNCEKIGLKVDVTGTHQSDPVMGVVFDGGISLGGLDVYLDQLSLGVHLNRVTDRSGYDIDLQGLDVSFSAGSVEVSGGLQKTTDAQSGFVSYDGEALIKAQTLTISALGSYGTLPGGGTSLFIFAVLNYPIGGPSFFFVTGLMAGFGYNRSLKIPALDNVQNFPLLAGLVNSSAIGGSKPKPQDALKNLEEWVPPERGEYWLAAGLQFTTFEIINTNALLIIEFGKELIISVIGISTLKQPLVGTAYVYAELDIEVVFLPTAGELKASAVLASSSYVLTPEAHLTGGFAFYAWFGSNAHAGDFVYTCGGYHPAFTVPSHYPQEPRLGINWQISDKIAMLGESYFAITPTAMMGGGGLSITFADGPLKAWFKATIDVILFWKPFYLMADASLSIGISMRIHVLFVDVTISIEIGANFHLWGPPIGGTVHIDWYIISFTIGFGADKAGPGVVEWNEFKGMLPSKPPVQDAGTPKQTFARRTAFALEKNADADPAATAAYLHINANKGLKRSHNVGTLTFWLVRPAQFQLTVGSALPATTIMATGADDNGQDVTKTFDYSTTAPTYKVGVRPVGISTGDYQSLQTVSILRLQSDQITDIQSCMASESSCTTQPAGCKAEPIDIQVWQVDLLTSALPQAMWGDPVAQDQNPNINAASATVPGAIGLIMSPSVPDLSCTPEMTIDEVFAERVVNADETFRLPLAEAEQPSGNEPQVVDSFVDIAGINDPPVIEKRGALFLALQTLGVNGWTNEQLPLMAQNPGRAFADEPMEGSVSL
jgi:hypothetical protein